MSIVDVNNFILDKECYIYTRENKYLYCINEQTDNSSRIFKLSTLSEDTNCLFQSYSIRSTHYVSNKICSIKSFNHSIYLSNNPSSIPYPLLIAYDHCNMNQIKDVVFRDLIWSNGSRIIHNSIGEALCYRELESNEIDFFFQTRKYDIYEDDTPYLSYIE